MKIRISISANIYNIDELETWLSKRYTGRDNIDKWLKSTLRTYLINTPVYHSRVSRSQIKTKEEWVKKAFEMNELFNINFDFLYMSAFEAELDKVIEYFYTLKGKRLNMNVPDAIELSRNYQESKREVKPMGKVQVLYTFPSDFKIVKLLDLIAFEREAHYLRNCLIDNPHEYYYKSLRNEIEIHSLWDAKSLPHANMEFDCSLNKIVQVRGKQDRAPVEKYQPYVMEWIGIIRSGKYKPLNRK